MKNDTNDSESSPAYNYYADLSLEELEEIIPDATGNWEEDRDAFLNYYNTVMNSGGLNDLDYYEDLDLGYHF